MNILYNQPVTVAISKSKRIGWVGIVWHTEGKMINNINLWVPDRNTLRTTETTIQDPSFIVLLENPEEMLKYRER